MASKGFSAVPCDGRRGASFCLTGADPVLVIGTGSLNPESRRFLPLQPASVNNKAVCGAPKMGTPVEVVFSSQVD